MSLSAFIENFWGIIDFLILLWAIFKLVVLLNAAFKVGEGFGLFCAFILLVGFFWRLFSGDEQI